ncbi:hypothetical protein ACGGZK_08375 [Agromyces sp. MMS24-K17]|uniref:hypothetical protein n=1 Tax=Agromyces sp. MMS24-K17 TaxID=3372850 RepID=UPI0037553CBE
MPDIEALAADPRMVAALSAANCARFDWHEALLAVGDMEVLYLVRAVDGRYSLNLTSRSSAERELARADELELVVDYLRFLLRSDVRVVDRGDVVPPGFRIAACDRELTLIRDDDDDDDDDDDGGGGGWRISVPDRIGARRGLIAFAVEGRDR